ncbi:MAG TPA: FHA domain-containing protein [candidate division Zixibacteria bacterium]|nr:FHA domain-containing protein [candidate division Zixibacteria bacterium]
MQTPVVLERRGGVEINQTAFLIGRHIDNALVINDDQASTHHARIISKGGRFHLEDLGSTNGTYVDGAEVGASVTLQSGSLIKIGATIIRFEYLPFPSDK